MPSPGYVFVEEDFSQLELRLVAWMAEERTMIELYRNGGDIHAATAVATMRMDPQYRNLTLEEFFQLPEEVIELNRYYAKCRVSEVSDRSNTLRVGCVQASSGLVSPYSRLLLTAYTKLTL